jgi:hypothetical protein
MTTARGRAGCRAPAWPRAGRPSRKARLPSERSPKSAKPPCASRAQARQSGAPAMATRAARRPRRVGIGSVTVERIEARRDAGRSPERSPEVGGDGVVKVPHALRKHFKAKPRLRVGDVLDGGVSESARRRLYTCKRTVRLGRRCLRKRPGARMGCAGRGERVRRISRGASRLGPRRAWATGLSHRPPEARVPCEFQRGEGPECRARAWPRSRRDRWNSRRTRLAQKGRMDLPASRQRPGLRREIGRKCPDAPAARIARVVGEPREATRRGRQSRDLWRGSRGGGAERAKPARPVVGPEGDNERRRLRGPDPDVPDGPPQASRASWAGRTASRRQSVLGARNVPGRARARPQAGRYPVRPSSPTSAQISSQACCARPRCRTA